MKTVLTIAGSDCSGGAGIQADIKTITVHGLYAMSAITALTAQNTMGIQNVMISPPEILAAQLDSIFTDIFPDAVKIGMPGNTETIRIIADRLHHYHAKNIVIDPVMISTSGRKLLTEEALNLLTRDLFPLASLITPNIPETEVLCSFPILTEMDMLRAARNLSDTYKTSVLIKGGHLRGQAADLLYVHNTPYWFCCNRIDNPNTHGTGCTLSSAIACRLAQGMTLKESTQLAKAYITRAIAAGLKLGHGNGPLNHMIGI